MLYGRECAGGWVVRGTVLSSWAALPWRAAVIKARQRAVLAMPLLRSWMHASLSCLPGMQ